MLAALGEGPARLSAGEVAASQRRRMLAAMVAAVAEKGYVATAVADVTKRARVSRATFYEQFEDKADCFVAAVAACVDQIVGRGQRPAWAARRRRRGHPPPPARGLPREPGRLPRGRPGVPGRDATPPAPGRGPAPRRRSSSFAQLFRRIHGRLADAGEPVRDLDDLDIELLVGGMPRWSPTAWRRMRPTAARPARAVEAFVLANFGLRPEA